VQINGRPITEELFCRELEEFLGIVRQSGQQPSYFELVYAFALWVISRQNVDYAVVETGVGGLHDATNIADRPDKVCVLTDIGFDHMHLLGATLPEIAAQKAGIIHAHNHAFIYRQSAEIMDVVGQWADQHQAPLHIVDQATEQKAHADILGAMPDYQRRNWLLANNVYQYLRERDNLPSLTRQASRQTQLVQVPGRMDVRHRGGKTLVMDGAHNQQKMTAFLGSFQQLYPGTEPAVLLALKDGKEYEELIPLLVPLAARLIVTTFRTSQDLPLVSLDPEVLAQALRAGGAANVETIEDSRQAFQALMAAPEELCVITGSFYLLGQIRNNEHLA
jgi:dihydrofolate synthase/folylpolyglutamate synthase